MKSFREIILWGLVVFLAVLFITEKCSKRGSGVTGPVVDNTVQTDTIILFDTVTVDRPVPEKVIVFDTIEVKREIQIPLRIRDTIVTVQIDTVEPEDIYVYEDTLRTDLAQLNWAIIAEGELITFIPELTVFPISVEVPKPQYLKVQSKFLIEPNVGFQLSENKIYTTLGMRLGYDRYTFTYLQNDLGNSYLVGYRIRF